MYHERPVEPVCTGVEEPDAAAPSNCRAMDCFEMTSIGSIFTDILLK